MQFPGTVVVSQLVSYRTETLVDLYYANYTNELVLYNAATNVTTVVQQYVPGGFSVFLQSAVAAGGSFWTAWVNSTTGLETFERVSMAGKVWTVTLHLKMSLPWSFPYGNATSLFVASGSSRLYEFDPSTRVMVANYSGLLPTGVVLSSLLPVGPRLYLAGSRALPNGSSNAWFGYLTPSTRAVTSLLKTRAYPSSLQAGLFSLAVLGGDVYVGGYLGTFNLSAPTIIQSVGGLFFRYSTANGTVTNLSWRLPTKGAGVFGIEPWHSTIILSLSRYTVSSTGATNATGGLFTLRLSGTGLLNRSSLLPTNYIIDVLSVTAESGGWFFSGGWNSASGLGQVVAVRV